MLPQISAYWEDFVSRLALEEDRKADAWAASGLTDMAQVPDIPASTKAIRDGRLRGHGPVHHRVPEDVREYVIPDFRPGIDTCGIELCRQHVEVMHWQGPGGTVLCVDDGKEQVVVLFLGLQEMPFNDVTVTFPKGRHDARETLLARAISEEEIDAHAVVATPFAAPGGNGSPLAEFWSFDPGAEIIEIMRNPDAVGEVQISVTPTRDGRDALVIIDGCETAILRGAPSASEKNVRVLAATA
ncbi:MAG: hypothetical protein AAF762_03755 [Pseudomonadota bacterium]